MRRYVLGMADETERREIVEHLRRRCAHCAAGVANARKHSRTVAPWAIAAALSVALVAIGIAGRRQIGDTAKIDRALPILNDPRRETLCSARRASLRGDASSSALIKESSSSGRVCRALRRGRLSNCGWSPPTEAPVPGGTFAAQPDATAVNVRSGPVDRAAAIEVTVEPEGGSAQPSTAPFIVAKL